MPKTTCPKFKNGTRECIIEVKHMPVNTFEYCLSDNYRNCPFFKMINEDPGVCKYIKNCVAFKCFAVDEFSKFSHIANKYCVSENHLECARFKKREAGEEVPAELHPDGHNIKNCV